MGRWHDNEDAGDLTLMGAADASEARNEEEDACRVEIPTWRPTRVVNNPGDYYANKRDEAAFYSEKYREAKAKFDALREAGIPPEDRGDTYEIMVALKNRLEMARYTGD